MNTSAQPASAKQYALLRARLGGAVRRDVRLARYTSFAIGGVADYFVSVRSRRRLIRALRAALEMGIPSVVIGAGNNILISDEGFRGLVIRNRWSGRVRVLQPGLLKAPAGIAFGAVVQAARDLSLSGLEYAAGIPGTVGGAVYMNAGAFGADISQRAVEGEILTRAGAVRTLTAREFRFGYRTSRLKRTGDILLSITLQLQPGRKRDIDARMKEIYALRYRKHPGAGVPCAGSYFKNLDPAAPGARRTAAGYVLEQAGAKSLHVGGAGVYAGHANFVINTGAATAADVRALARLMKRRVRQQYNIRLEEEVRYLDAHTGFPRT